MNNSSLHTPWIAAPVDADAPRRSLILSGGGIRLSYQTGALKALKEAGLRFDHVDATSGGALNLAMTLSGQEPDEMTERWKTLDLRRSLSLMPLRKYLRSSGRVAMGSADGFREYVLPHLGIDMSQVQSARGVQGSFNVLNYGRKVVEVFPHETMDEDLLIAGLSLPGVMPPVPYNGSLYLDAAFVKDANLMEAVRRGAEELWVVWCLGNTERYRGGPLHIYVQMLEMAALGALHDEFAQIKRINERIRAGDSPFGQRQPIRLHLIRPRFPLPLDPDLYLGRITNKELIAHGYSDTCAYLQSRSDEGLPFTPDVTRMATTQPGIRFRETMQGPFALGQTDPQAGYEAGRRANSSLALHASIHIPSMERFVNDSDHEGRIHGEVDFQPLGNGLPSSSGRFNLFKPGDAPNLKLMVYEMGFQHDGKDYYLAGRKYVRNGRLLDVWSDTTTLYTQLHEGTDKSGPVLGAGVLSLGIKDLIALLSTLHATDAQGIRQRARAVSMFGWFFSGELWDSYGLGSRKRDASENSA